MITALHEDRLSAVLMAVRDCGAGSVLDLGCGDGDLFLRLAAEPDIHRLVGIDIDTDALERLRHRLAAAGVSTGKTEVRLGSMTRADPALTGFDCAVLVETIEHIDPGQLSQLERAVFGQMRPGSVIVTTPNAEFNPLLGVPPHRFRHPDHRFEWTRARFRTWGERVAAAAGYRVTFRNIAGHHPDLGGASQMAAFQMPTKAPNPAGGPFRS